MVERAVAERSVMCYCMHILFETVWSGFLVLRLVLM